MIMFMGLLGMSVSGGLIGMSVSGGQGSKSRGNVSPMFSYGGGGDNMSFIPPPPYFDPQICWVFVVLEN